MSFSMLRAWRTSLTFLVHLAERASYYGCSGVFTVRLTSFRSLPELLLTRPSYPQNFIQRPLPAGGNGAGAPPAGTQVSFSAMNHSTFLTILLSHRKLVSYDSLPLPGSSNQGLYLLSTSWCSRTWTDRGHWYREDIPVSCLRSPHPWRYSCGYEMGSIQDDLHWDCNRCSGPHYHDDM